MAKPTRTFSDIDLRFTVHPTTGDIATLIDEQAVKNAVKNLVMTTFYERKFHPEIGSQVNSLLFEHSGPLLDVLLRNAITETITNFESRVELLNVQVMAAQDNYSVYVKIEFRILNTTNPISLNITLERTR